MSDDIDVEDESPSGSNRDGYTTSPVTDGRLAYDIRNHARLVWHSNHEHAFADNFRATWDRQEAALGKDRPELTVHRCWSGYSEYTITNVWSEVSYRLGEVEQHFPGVAAFLAAIADAADRIEEDKQLEWMQALTKGAMP